MRQVEKIKIFLASPSDVKKERSYVVEVINEINRTIASKGVILEVVSSEHTFPGYAQDGQSVLNKQIGAMKEYDIFLGIMWSRAGTATPRAESGTIEEFQRAVRAKKNHNKPEIWFYFRKLEAHLETTEKLQQAQKVVAFKKKVQHKALIRDYNNPSHFRDQFRENLSRWLNERTNKTSRPRISAASQNKKSPIARTNSPSPTTDEGKQKKVSSTSTAVDIKRKISSTSTTADIKRKPRSSLTTKKPSSTGSSSTVRTVKSISSSGAWVMLNHNFFLTESVDTQANQTVTLHISPTNSEQEAALRNLQPEQPYNKKQIAYAYQNDAAMMQVESVLSKSIKGKTILIVTLGREPNSQRSCIEINFDGCSADRIADLRARLLLLNKTPYIQKNNNFSHFNSVVEGGYDNAIKIEKNIFPDLWNKLKEQPNQFLFQARLVAVYYLKMSRTVEHILELKLGLIKGNVMSVQFRGQRKSLSINQEPAVIQFQGSCPLSG